MILRCAAPYAAPLHGPIHGKRSLRAQTKMTAPANQRATCLAMYKEMLTGIKNPFQALTGLPMQGRNAWVNLGKEVCRVPFTARGGNHMNGTRRGPA